MNDKTRSTLDKIIRLTQQNAEFDAELRKRLNIASANSAIINDERITQIYEYCIEKIIKKQAIEFYQDFPLTSIKPTLVEDFCRMESFRRKDNFGDFCLSLYQQIECITNKLCEDHELSAITSKMWGCFAYITGNNISNRFQDKYNTTIARLIFYKPDDDLYSIEKSKSTLQEQTARYKMKILVYFLGYKAMMKTSDFNSYIEFTYLLSDIYMCRNMNHRGNTSTEREDETLKKINSLQSFHYFKFMGGLTQYVDYIKKGLEYIPELKKYSDSLSLNSKC